MRKLLLAQDNTPILQAHPLFPLFSRHIFAIRWYLINVDALTRTVNANMFILAAPIDFRCKRVVDNIND
jgi:hypothetical protein